LILKNLFSQKEKLSKNIFFFKMYNVYNSIKWRLNSVKD
jgi:hypothetical protein